MVSVIDSKKEFEDFKRKIKNTSSCVVVPIFSDERKNPNETSLSLLIVSFDKDDTYIICSDHSESVFDVSDISFLKNVKKVYVYDKKKFLQAGYNFGNFVDIQLLKWFKSTETFSFQKLPKYFQSFPRSGHKVSSYDLPIFKISEYYDGEVKKLHQIVSEYNDIINESSFKRYNQDFIEVFSEIESNGLEIERSRFYEVFRDKIEREFDNRVYTNYNIYTSTGRPSNSNHNINFSALDSEENQKDPFISRFSDGFLVNFDYDAFHLRLIGNLVGYELPSESFHKYLGKKYFGKNELSDKEYEESKNITFQLLYGRDLEEARNLEFFKKTYDMKNEMWDLYKEYGMVQTPMFKRMIYSDHLSEMNPGKVFSYVLQGYETEFNVVVLKKVIDLLKNYKTEIILYTYDSFLFDYSFSDGKGVIKKIKNIMETNDMMVKSYIGRRFNEMKKIDE